MAILSCLPGLLAAFVAASFHWLPGCDRVTALAVLLLAGWGMLWRRQHRLFWPVLGVVVVELLSATWNQTELTALIYGPLPLVGLCLLPDGWLRSSRWLNVACLTSGVIAWHAILCFLAFRGAGGGHLVRPDIDQGWLHWLVWPYYCGHYPRGAHAIGWFLNDNNLGIFCAASLALTLVHREQVGPGSFRRLLNLTLGGLFLGVVWSYSRSAMLACFGSLLCLAWQRRRGLLWILVAAPGLYALLATGMDWRRVGTGIGQTLGGRMLHVREAADALMAGRLLGAGPGSAGLVDSQPCRTALELGWLGVIAYTVLFACALRAAQSRPGIQAAMVALLLGAVGCDLLCTPQLAGMLFVMCGLAFESVEGEDE